VAPKVISGTVGAIGTARRMFRTVTDAGREFLDDIATPVSAPAPGTGPAAAGRSARLDPVPPGVPNGGTRLGPPQLAPPAAAGQGGTPPNGGDDVEP
jgi:hypothetical protein